MLAVCGRRSLGKSVHSHLKGLERNGQFCVENGDAVPVHVDFILDQQEPLDVGYWALVSTIACLALQQPPAVLKRFLEVFKDSVELPAGSELGACSGSTEDDGELETLQLLPEGLDVIFELKILLVYQPSRLVIIVAVLIITDGVVLRAS